MKRLLVFAGGVSLVLGVYSAVWFLTASIDAEAPKVIPPVEWKVTMRDSLGRVELVEVRAKGGSCVINISYRGVPRVHALAISFQTGRSTSGYLEMRDATTGVLLNRFITKDLAGAIHRLCFPYIVPGYVSA